MFRMWSLLSCGVVCGLLECQLPSPSHQFLFLWPRILVMDMVFSCIMKSSSVLAYHPAVCLSIEIFHFGHVCWLWQLYLCMCISMHAFECVSVHLSTWTLTPSLINVRGLCQTLHAAFRCDRQILGPSVTPGVWVGTMFDASTKLSRSL